MELKATSSGEIRARNALLGCWRYEKYEADKVIAKKDKLIAYAQALVLKDIEIIRHHKYKRCLAMAKFCRSCWAANIFIHEGPDRISMHYMKWEKR